VGGEGYAEGEALKLGDLLAAETVAACEGEGAPEAEAEKDAEALQVPPPGRQRREAGSSRKPHAHAAHDSHTLPLLPDVVANGPAPAAPVPNPSSVAAGAT
jgi:hypothetical protein